MNITGEKLDELIANLPNEDKIRSIKSLTEYKEKLPEEGKRGIDRRIKWLKKTMKKKSKKKKTK